MPSVEEVLALAKLDGRPRCPSCETRLRPGQVHGGGYVETSSHRDHIVRVGPGKRRATAHAEAGRDEQLLDAAAVERGFRGEPGLPPRGAGVSHRAKARVKIPVPWDLFSLARLPCPPVVPVVLVDALPEPDGTSLLRWTPHRKGVSNAARWIRWLNHQEDPVRFPLRGRDLPQLPEDFEYVRVGVRWWARYAVGRTKTGRRRWDDVPEATVPVGCDPHAVMVRGYPVGAGTESIWEEHFADTVRRGRFGRAGRQIAASIPVQWDEPARLAGVETESAFRSRVLAWERGGRISREYPSRTKAAIAFRDDHGEWEFNEFLLRRAAVREAWGAR